jgi:hypothetical protein
MTRKQGNEIKLDAVPTNTAMKQQAHESNEGSTCCETIPGDSLQSSFGFEDEYAPAEMDVLAYYSYDKEKEEYIVPLNDEIPQQRRRGLLQDEEFDIEKRELLLDSFMKPLERESPPDDSEGGGEYI